MHRIGECSMVEGPDLDGIMYSLWKQHDPPQSRFDITFKVLLPRERRTIVRGVVVGIEGRIYGSPELVGVKVQLLGRLYEFDPSRTGEVDCYFPWYDTAKKTGLINFTPIAWNCIQQL